VSILHVLCSTVTSSSVCYYCWLGVTKSIRPVDIEWLDAGMVICLERSANDLHMIQLSPSDLFSHSLEHGLPFWCWPAKFSGKRGPKTCLR